MREWQSQSHVRWYCRYHVVVGAEVSKTSDLRRDATWGWENRSGVMSAARRGVGGRACAVGSRACLVGNSTEVECGEHGGVLEREVGDPHSSGVSGAAAQLHGLPLWARGYCVSTVGLAEEVIRDYIRKQEADEKKQEKLELG